MYKDFGKDRSTKRQVALENVLFDVCLKQFPLVGLCRKVFKENVPWTLLKSSFHLSQKKEKVFSNFRWLWLQTCVDFTALCIYLPWFCRTFGKRRRRGFGKHFAFSEYFFSSKIKMEASMQPNYFLNMPGNF